MAVLGQGTYYQQVDYISLYLGKDGSESNATKSKLEDIRVLDKNHGRSDQVKNQWRQASRTSHGSHQKNYENG